MNGRQIAVRAVALVFAVAACSARTVDSARGPAPRAQVEVTSSPNTIVDIYGSVPSRFALRGEPLLVRSDTLRARTPLNFYALLDAGDIIIRSASGAQIKVVAAITNGPATRVTMVGPHMVLEAGGTGIRGPR